jgi:hypothetical protein
MCSIDQNKKKTRTKALKKKPPTFSKPSFGLGAPSL